MDWGPPLRPPLPPPPDDPEWRAPAAVTTIAWPPSPAPSQRGLRFRLDIEGLRALAVVLVLAYHAELGPFQGGFVGVDVFFVVSGFLITSLLLDELQAFGFITLRRFWARRARRLLPAASLVIVATVVAAVMILDPLTADDVAHDAVAAALFVINIVLARRQTDYLAGNLSPSPLQHFWSLAVEEQFYLFWPVLLQVLAGYRRRPRAVVTAIVVVAWPLSYWACVSLTRTNQPWAFYSLPTRAWELLTGVVLALAAGLVLRLPGWFRSVVGWAGLVAIVAAAVDYSATTIFPGPGALLPVLGTMAVVAAGPSAPGGPIVLLRHPTLTWTGARSYSIYLWHWPALVLVAAYFGPLPAGGRLAVVLASVVVAALTFAVLEDPVRHWRWLAATAHRGLALGASLVAIAVTTAMVALASSPSLAGAGAGPAVAVAPLPPPAPVASATTSPATTSFPASTPVPAVTALAAASPPPTTVSPAVAPPPAAPGPEELAARNEPVLEAGLATEQLPVDVQPSVRGARTDVPGVDHDGCNLDATVTTPGPCTFGDTSSTTTIVIFGDSHAAQWFPALDAITTQHRWRLLVMTKKGCPSADIAVFSPMVGRELRECDAWRTNVVDRLAGEHPSLIILSSFRYARQMGAWSGVEPNEAWQRGLTATLDSFAPLGAKLLVLGDTPTPAQDAPSCVAGHLNHVSACAAQRADAVRDDRLSVERDVAAAHGAAFVPTSDWLCTATACPVIADDLFLYRDNNHITATAATWLAPLLDAAMTPLLEPAPAAPPAPTAPPTPLTAAAGVVTTAAPPEPTTSAPPPTTAATPPPCALSFVADSVGAGLLGHGLGASLDALGCQLVWKQAIGGLDIGAGTRSLAAAADEPTNGVLVMLGFHNARSEVGTGRFPDRIDAVLQAAGSRLVIWPLLAPTNECSSGYKQALQEADAQLQAAQQRWTNLVLIDYPTFLAAHPEYSNHDCPHLLPAGYEATAAWLAGEVRQAVSASPRA